jgi:hypothetical protein
VSVHRIRDDEKTPVDGKTPFEMVLDKLNEVGADTKVAVREAREAKSTALKTYDLQLQLNERIKRVDQRLMIVEASRLWLPLVALALAALALARTW